MHNQLLNNAVSASTRGQNSGVAGVVLAVVGAGGWFTGEHLLGVIALLVSATIALVNGYYSLELARFKAHLEAIAYARKVAKESGIDLPPIDSDDLRPGI